jgi:hypothetical protein
MRIGCVHLVAMTDSSWGTSIASWDDLALSLLIEFGTRNPYDVQLGINQQTVVAG